VGFDYLLSPYVSRKVVVVIVLIYLVAITGGLHEDALGDAADGFGGGWEKERVLAIMRDSRLGSFGALAIMLGLLARFVFLTSLPAKSFHGILLAGQVLSRWTALPLGFFLPSARGDQGQGVLVAGNISRISLGVGTTLAVAIVGVTLQVGALWVLPVSVAVTGISAAYYRRRIGSVTGDCMGATFQLTEVAVYFTGVLLQ
jgi:adenosylcobinamide-GDP ribazoletransferase